MGLVVAALAALEASQDVSFRAMAERQQALARVLLREPAVASLSSFIGIDGTNTTVNRRLRLELTPAGQALAKALFPLAASVDHAVEAGLSRPERDAMMFGLKKVLSNLDRFAPTGDRLY